MTATSRRPLDHVSLTDICNPHGPENHRERAREVFAKMLNDNPLVFTTRPSYDGTNVMFWTQPTGDGQVCFDLYIVVARCDLPIFSLV